MTLRSCPYCKQSVAGPCPFCKDYGIVEKDQPYHPDWTAAPQGATHYCTRPDVPDWYDLSDKSNPRMLLGSVWTNSQSYLEGKISDKCFVPLPEGRREPSKRPSWGEIVHLDGERRVVIQTTALAT